MADAISAATTLGYRTGTSPDVYTNVINITNIEGLSSQRAAIDSTNLSSTRHTRRVGIPDDQPLTASINYTPAGTTHKYLLTSFEAGTNEHWKLVFSDSETLLFTGYVSKFSPKAPDIDGNLQADIEITPDGASVTWPA